MQTVSADALAGQQKRINQMYKVGRMSEDDWEAECREIAAQQARLTAPPAPLFQQQQSVLTTLVDAWDEMTVDARKRMLAAIFDSVTATADGVDRLEPCEDWKPYVVAAIPKPVTVPPPDDGCHRSGRRDSNPRPRPWQGRALPLRHFRETLLRRDYTDRDALYWLGIVQSFGTIWIQVWPGASRTDSPAALVSTKTSKMSGRVQVTS
jgi:hypothetical protein